MGWGARANPVAHAAKVGSIAAKPRVVKTLSAREDDWLSLWYQMCDRVHGIPVMIAPRVDPLTQKVA